MKIFRLKTVHFILFETTARSYRINELEGEDGTASFSWGEPGHIADMVPLRMSRDPNKILHGARNLLEAKAAIINEGLDATEFLKGNQNEAVEKAWLMLSEIKNEDLPLLLGKFENLQSLIECRLKGEIPKFLIKEEKAEERKIIVDWLRKFGLIRDRP